jgi:D-beta-D-heptose 7-phosphate kinase/D-beta-D-heptose 1-phosphate adenosyltransferase
MRATATLSEERLTKGYDHGKNEGNFYKPAFHTDRAMTKTDDLRDYIEKMNNASILVIGDIMLDRYFYGNVSRISPEAPVPVLHVNKEGRMLGGAGNVLRNLDGLNVKTKLIAVIGDDRDGEIVTNMITALSHVTQAENSLITSERSTTVKSRYVAHGQQLLRADEEDKSAISKEIEDKIIALVKDYAKDCQAVILSDYDKGVLTPRVISESIRICNDYGVKTLIDPKGNDYSIYKGSYVVTPNRDELSKATYNAPTREDGDVVNAALSLIKNSGIQNVVATRSEDGMTIVQSQADGANIRPVHIPTEALEVFDVSGAGDTVIATIAAGLAAGADLIDAARLANIAGGIVVAKTGTAPVSAEEILERLAPHKEQSESLNTAIDHLPTLEASIAQIYDWDGARQQIEEWQRNGMKVGLTNGCFDLLHPGHVQYLHEARCLCDRLILALNTDVSVKLLKGPTRPIQDEMARANVIGALAAVDMVVFFGAEKEGEDNTASAVLAHLQPDLYVKGGDYKIEDIPEAKVARSYGGDAKVLCLVDGHSTTNNINKIKSF